MIVSRFLLSACILGVLNIANSTAVKSNNQKGICSSKRIVNLLNRFERLDHCEVIEGSLKIALLQGATPEEFSNISFPLLREITGYLLLFNVKGLKSIGQLFPNLSVIRGHETKRGKSFIIFDLPDLEDIGLYSLAEITHGQVYINEAPSLCYVNTIDWGKIVKEKSTENFIKTQTLKTDCPKCESTALNANEKCPIQYDKEGTLKYFCWNKNHCQKMCPPNCKSCNNKLECCNEKCSACTDKDVNTCTVCSNYIEENGSQTNCTDVCSPSAIFKYSSRRCINRTQCLEMGGKLEEDNNCVLTCPYGYRVMNDYCVPTERCKKYCAGKSISSIRGLRELGQFDGCTHVIGSLDISDITDQYDVQDSSTISAMKLLAKYLGRIEKISGYLRVKDSEAVTSLDFLKNLKEIKGKEKVGGNFSLVVVNNTKITKLWKNNNVRIRDGRLQFKSNPQLCIQKFVDFQKKSGMIIDNYADFRDNGNKGLECKSLDIEEQIAFEDDIINDIYLVRPR